ncbi:hypothetical protein EDB85DRAFT_2151125 [Lactarius pseudohatsudake]|nr:hypothetical protein EDB85DRAFT_2151125 [Lactarius pseudohatsudake]
MSPDIEQISFPHSRPMSNEAAVTGASQYLPLLTQDLNPPSRAMSDFADGSDALFSMYNEMAAERDRKLAENWREDANGIMLLSGLLSATVAGFLSQSYLSSQTSSQDVSAFYLSQLYQFQAASSNSSGAPPPAPPNPASAPTGAHMLWFASLVLSLATAVFATLIQEWVRRYLVMTQSLYSPHKNARVRAFIWQQGSLAVLQNTIKILHALLHQSIFFFLFGLVVLISSGNSFVLAAVILCIIPLLFLYLWFSLAPYFYPHSLFSTPFSGLLLSLRQFPLLALSLFRTVTRRGSVDNLRRGANAPADGGWLTLVYTATEIEKLAETRTSALDSWAISSLLTSLSREQEMEQFLAGIPSFYRSTRVQNPTEVLRESNTDRLPQAILAFIDHSFSSDLVSDTTRRQRLNISLKAIQADSYLLQRTFYHALGFIDSAVFTCIDFVLLADQHANDDDPDVRFLARCIVAVAINRLGDSYHTDGRWAGIIQRGLNWSEDNFAEYSEQRDSTRLRNLIQLARELNTAHPDCNDPSARTIFGHTLCAVRRLEVDNAALGLRHEFCGLWNQLVASMHDQRRHTVVRSNAMFILSHIRTIYVTLHQGTESRSFAFSAFSDDLDPALQKTSSYPRCTVSSHRVPSAYDPDA